MYFDDRASYHSHEKDLQCGKVADSGCLIAGLYSYAALVNINLAVVNVLPLPALDGGYLLLLAIEATRRGQKLPEEVEATFQISGFLLLMGTGIFLIVRDTINMLPK
jgi:membrane-associated protease RseP (regulator of RpoE activity)